MKRPLCLAALIITALVYLYLELSGSENLVDVSNTGDGCSLQIVGIVDRKEFRVDYLGEVSPVIYIIPIGINDLGNNKYIQCYMSKEDYNEPAIGQYVKVAGTQKSFDPGRNPGEFDSRLYYSTLKIAYRIKNANILAVTGKKDTIKEGLYQIKYQLESVLDKSISSEDASIMKAIILGDKAFMDEETKSIYKDAGIIHIMAVSGLHISILGMGLYKLLRRLRIPLIPATILPIAFMFGYGQMCGMSASSVRAIVMFGVRLMAPVLGRTYDLLSALSLVEIMLLIEQPLYLYNSGFLFSFGAVVAIGFVMPAIKSLIPNAEAEKMKFSDDKESVIKTLVYKYIGSALFVSISILLVAIPVYMSFYYVYPIYSIILNLFILPLMPPLMLLGIICMLFGSFLGILGLIPGVMIHVILRSFSLLCKVVGTLPGGKWYMGNAPKWKIVLYVAALIMFSVLTMNQKFSKYKATITASYLSVLFLLIINPVPDLKITAIDVGQGDGILIRTRTEALLIDGGSTDKNQVGKYTIIPYLKHEGVGQLDMAIVTHEDEDHISGIFEIMDDMEKGGITIKNLILPDVGSSSRGSNYRMLEERARELHIPVSYISCGQGLAFNDMKLTCLNPVKDMTTDGANAYSTVLFMEYENFTALFTGDVEEEGQAHIMKDVRANSDKLSHINLLKVAHHGSRYTSDEEFLKALRPGIALISCGEGNSYGHPHRELIERLDAVGTRIYRTDKSGAITVIVNNNRVYVDEFLAPL